LKKRRNRNKKKTDNEIALNNFMRQVAGDVSATKSAKPTAKNDRGQKKPTSKIDKPE
jgi:hypothetical protein